MQERLRIPMSAEEALTKWAEIEGNGAEVDAMSGMFLTTSKHYYRYDMLVCLAEDLGISGQLLESARQRGIRRAQAGEYLT